VVRLVNIGESFIAIFAPLPTPTGIQWAKQLIQALWHYTDSIWKHRNGAVQRKDYMEQHLQYKESMIRKITKEY
jgi:cell envelope opacity-associated protein A